MANEKKVAKSTKEFKESDVVVYPLQGVGVVKGIEERTFKEKKTRYYNIYIEISDMTIMVPIEKSAELGIRPIVSKRKAETLLEKITMEENYIFSTDWKMRYQNSIEQIRDGTLLEITKILKAMYLRSKTKDLPIMERKLYDSSLHALVTEVALAIKQPEEEVRKTLFEKFDYEDAPPPAS